MLPKEKKKTAKPKKEDEVYSTKNNAEVVNLINKGFHVEEQKIVDEELVWFFKESKAEIEKAK